MNEDELKALLDAARQAQPDADAKQRNLDAASKAFAQALDEKNSETDQGSDESLRPTADNIVDLSRNSHMNASTVHASKIGRWAYSGLASAALIVLAVGLLFNQVNQDPMLIPPVYEQPSHPDEAAKLGQNSEPNPLSWRAETKQPQAPLEETVASTGRVSIELTPHVQSPAVAEMQSDMAQAKSRQMQLPALASYSRPDFEGPSHTANRESRDNFSKFDANPVQSVADNPVSTFSIDVDTAAYSFVRRQLKNGLLPQKSAVRLEEMVNYFDYDYPAAQSLQTPFEPTISVLPSPWNANNQLVHIGIKGFEAERSSATRSNIVFLLDVSGSMSQPDKLPLVQKSLTLLLSQLHPEDTVAIAVYAGAAGTVLAPTPVREKRKILDALRQLKAGGSTAGAQGIKLAYELAEAHYVEGGVNRVFLATDGDFNVGITNQDELQGFIERKRDSGIYLSVLGFGQGNYQDALMQKLAQNGNGIAAYIDTLSEARKVLVDEAQSQLFPIANDVKIQIEFNPATVSEYRLLGYETRALKKEDFKNDKIDAGEIGAGHTVTAIYEVTPRGSEGLLDSSRYGVQQDIQKRDSSELGFLKIRYKKPGDEQSNLIEQPISSTLTQGTTESRFAVAVAGFSQLLTGGHYTGSWGYSDALELAMNNRGADEFGYRVEFTQLIRAAMTADEI